MAENEIANDSGFPDTLDDVEYEIVDDRPSEDRVSERDPSTLEDQDFDSEIGGVDKKVKKRISRLRYEYHEQRREKDAANRMRDEAVNQLRSVHGQNQQLRQLLNQGEQVLISEVQARAASEAAKAKEAYKSAYEEGDADAIADAQEEMVRAQQESALAQRSQPKAPPVAPPEMQQQPQQQPPVQADPRAVDWMNKNSWFGKDEEMTSFAYGLHDKLVRREGVDPRSDEYYARIDKRMREIFPAQFGGGQDGNQVATPRARQVVSPSTRNSGGNPRTVQLTATQVALAKRLGITPKQYATQLLKETGNA